MPHLNELSKQYKDKVVFTAINIWEEREPKDDSYLAKVEKYVSDFGDGMSFNVAADDPSGTVAKAWMEASGSNGIPTSFIVDGEGKIAWIGHPMNLDGPLKALVEGTYDPVAEKDKRDKATKAAAERRALFAPINKAVNEKDYPKAVAEIDKIMATKPDMLQSLAFTKYNLLFNYDEAGAYAWGKELSDGMFKDNADALNSIAWPIIDPAAKTKRKSPDYKLAIEIAEKANTLSEDKNPMIMDTLALAYWLGGRKADALALQERAVAIAEKTEGFSEDMLKDLKDRLAEWKSGG